MAETGSATAADPDDTASASQASATPADAEFAARLEKLRADGVDRKAPLAFARIEAVARRALDQAPPIRTVLLARLNSRIDALGATPSLKLEAAATPSAAPPAPTADATAPGPLAALLDYIARHAGSLPAAHSAPSPRPRRSTGAAPELKSVAYFRQTWSRLSTEQQLTQTLAQAPANAGPMNSQHLVLRALESMRDISPDYLQAFMSYVDTLIWLEQADPSRQPTTRSTGDGEKKRRATSRKTTPKKT